MKRLALLSLVAALAAPAAAQAPPTSAVSQAVSNTLRASIERQYPAQDAAWWDDAVSSIADANATLFDSTCGSGKTWLCAAIYLQLPSPTPMGTGQRHNDRGGFEAGSEAGEGGFGGAGAWSGDWNDERQDPCDNFAYQIDPQGNLVVPSFKLATGTAMVWWDNNDPSDTHEGKARTWSVNQTGFNWQDGWSGGATHATDPEAIALYYLHALNMSTVRNAWRGVYKMSFQDNNGPSKRFTYSSVAYYNSLGQVYGRQAGSVNPTNRGSNNPWPISSVPDGQDCPNTGGGGGDFHFYWHQASGGCIWYAPNFSLGVQGYAYPEKASIPLSEALIFPRGMNDSTLACPLSPEFIRAISDRIWDRAKGQPGVPSSGNVEPDDVRTGGEDPQLDDLDEPPQIPAPADNTEPPTPSPTPTPTPTPTGGVDLGPDPGVGSPELGEAPTGLMDPIFDWLPDLPSITIDVGSAACPTWQMQPFDGPEWLLVMDSHCGFIEDNRAAIGALMVVLFTIGAAMIILRA